MKKSSSFFLFRTFFALGILFLCSGMAGGGALGRGELKPEIRLKLYNEAINHYQKAQALYQTGKSEAALKEIKRATKVVSAFPEAYELARQIYAGMGKEQEANEQTLLYEKHGGKGGASLYRLREKVIQEIAVQKMFAPKPNIYPLPAYLLSVLFVAVLVFGMSYEYRRIVGDSKDQVQQNSLILESFPGDEEGDMRATWLFKGCALLLPVPILFSILVFFGLRNFSEMLPMLLFTWAVVAVAVHLIFFADLKDLGGLRRQGPGGR